MRTQFQPSTSHSFSAGTIAVVLASLAPIAANAQQPIAQPLLPTVQVEAPRNTEQKSLAQRLEAQAAALRASPKTYFEAGQLYRRAALLRGTDSAAVSSYRSAAWMFSAAGENALARRMMEQAAERAADVGDVERAAHCFIDAALLAVASGRDEKVPEFLERMHAVLTSPLLEDERRSGILQRIEGSPTLAVVDAAVRRKK